MGFALSTHPKLFIVHGVKFQEVFSATNTVVHGSRNFEREFAVMLVSNQNRKYEVLPAQSSCYA